MERTGPTAARSNDSPQDAVIDIVEQDPDELGVALDCAGVPAETPVAISLHLQNGRIARVETHNADLMKGY